MYFNDAESLNVMFELNQNKFLHDYVSEESLSPKNKYIREILETLNSQNYTLELNQVLDLFEASKTYAKDPYELAGPILIMLQKLEYLELETEAFNVINTKKAPSYDIATAADVISSRYGIPNFYDYIERKYKKELQSDIYIDEVPEELQIWLTMNNLEAQVNNGGLAQYFSNNYGDELLLAIKHSKTIGLPNLSKLLTEVKQLFLKYNPKSTFSDDDLAKIYDDIEDKLENYDDQFYDLPQIEVNLKLYLCSKHSGVNLLSKLNQ